MEHCYVWYRNILVYYQYWERYFNLSKPRLNIQVVSTKYICTYVRREDKNFTMKKFRNAQYRYVNEDSIRMPHQTKKRLNEGTP